MVSLRYRWAIFKHKYKDTPLGKLWAPALVAVLMVILVFASSLLWIEVQRRFPFLPPGSYQGEFARALEAGEGEETIRFYAESTPDESLLFALLHPGWEPQFSSMTPVDSASEEKQVLPVIVSGEGGKLQFTGREVTPGEFRGVVTNLSTGYEGVWKLFALREGGERLSEDEEEQLRNWLKEKVELKSEQETLQSLKDSLALQETELQRLSAAIQEGESLREDGNSRYEEVRKEFEKMQTVLRKKLDAARKLQGKVELSHKVTKKGKLVSLSREAAERDNRWLESMLRSQPAELAPDLEEALARAYKLAELREEIVEEQRLIEEILREAQRPNRMALPSREEGVF
jgi:hypothetical protein